MIPRPFCEFRSDVVVMDHMPLQWKVVQPSARAMSQKRSVRVLRRTQAEEKGGWAI